jgi:hypothetical protein
MDFRNFSDPVLVDFAKNIEGKLTAHEVICLPNDLADQLAATIAALNTSFEAVIETSVEIDTNKAAIFQDKRNQRAELLNRLGVIQSYLHATEGNKKYFDMCGFNYPKTPSTIVAADPTDLVATGTSNAVNKIAWTGNNRPGGVVYELWRRHGDTADWGFLTVTRRQVFTDTPVTPGQYYEYKVRAIAAKTMSNWSNTAVVYGAP